MGFCRAQGTAATAHIVGAGVAGLAAAVALAERGWHVQLSEAGPVAGGRCRSYLDRELGVRIDNGNHLLLNANHATMAYLAKIGARDTLTGPGRALFPFFDLTSGERWTLAPNRGRLPWWIFSRARRVKGTHARDYVRLTRLWTARSETRVAEVVGKGVLARRLLRPIATAALNTPPEAGSARLFAQVVRETLGRGGAACVPWLPRVGLSETFITPALTSLAARGAEIGFGRRVSALEIADKRIRALVFAGSKEHEQIGPYDRVVLAVPATIARGLVPGLSTPLNFAAILNVHYRLVADQGETRFTAVIGGLAEWVFVKREVVSVTVSAANRVIDQPAAVLAEAIWPEVSAVLGINAPMPAWRVVKERRATFAATPEEERRRPGPRSELRNLFLAGDWTKTGLPGTIEGAIRSGERAAELVRAENDGVCDAGRNARERNERRRT